MIEIKNLSKTYNYNTHALQDVSLTLPRGEIVGLFGENGAGKTTLMKCILNFLRYKGGITLDGEPITRKNIAKLSFATCEHSFFPTLTANGHRDFYREHFETFNEKRFQGLLDFFELPATSFLKPPDRQQQTGGTACRGDFREHSRFEEAQVKIGKKIRGALKGAPLGNSASPKLHLFHR